MTEFMIRFLICNIFISIIIGIFLPARHLLNNKLTNRMQYNLWFLLLILLAVPFIPVQPIRSLQIFSWFATLKNASSFPVGTVLKETTGTDPSNTANWMNDLSISISRKAPSTIGFILCILWGIGISVMIILLLRSMLRFNILKKSALPLQNSAIHKLYHDCLDEMHITKPIPIYSTAFLKSPIIAGLFKPRIYLPIHLISDCHANDIKYMLLHELVHYKYKDAFANYAMNLICILYWFNPLIWYSLQEMKMTGKSPAILPY